MGSGTRVVAETMRKKSKVIEAAIGFQFVYY